MTKRMGKYLYRDEYIEPADGPIRCKKCRVSRQTVVPRFGGSGYFMPRCLCPCQQKGQEERKAMEEQKERMEHIKRRKAQGLQDNRLTGVFAEDRAAFIASLDDYSLLVIDDLGVERSTEYAMEQMFTVIDSRYRSKKPLIVTTNLKLEEIKNPPDLAHARIYDRILERCAPVLFSGKNFREEGAMATKAAAKEIVRKDNKI